MKLRFQRTDWGCRWKNSNLDNWYKGAYELQVRIVTLSDIPAIIARLRQWIETRE